MNTKLAERPSTSPAPAPATAGAPAHRTSGLTLFCVRHRWSTLVLSVLALVLGIVAMMGVGITTTSPEQQLVGDSAAGFAAQEKAGMDEVPSEMIIVTTKSGPMSPEAAARISDELTAAYAGVQGIAEVGKPFPGKDGRSVVLPATLDAASSDDDTSGRPTAMEAVAPMLETTESFRAAHPDVQVGQFGTGSADKEMDETISGDFKRAELFSIPVTLVILLLAFGAVVAAGVPLLLGLGSVAVAFGLTSLASTGFIPVDPNAQSMILLIGLAVGVDYALFVIRRAREERAAGADNTTAIAIAGATAGRAVVISGLTVIVAMAGMLVAGGLFTSLALGAILVVLAAVIAASTTLPALLAVLGDKVDALRLPFSRKRWARAGSPDSMWGRLAGAVTRRPLVWGGTAAAALAAVAIPAFGMQTALGGVESLPADLQVVKAYHQLEKAVPSDGTALTLVVTAPAAAAATVADELAPASSTGQAATAIAHVSGVAEQPTVSDDKTVTTLDIGIGMTGSDDRLAGVVDEVRTQVVPTLEKSLADNGINGVEVNVAGQAASTDLSAWMMDRLPWVMGFVLVLTLLVMTISFGSPSLAAATVALNMLSVGAAYGVMTLVFQGTWAEGLLDFTSSGSIVAWLPMLMFVILFGLSMDYHVFVTSRVREAYVAGHSPREAVRLGVARSAGVVTSAAAVMIAVFAIFGTLSVMEMKQLGVGLATAVLIDATVVRGVLLPATLSLLGHRAHRGPKWLPVIHH